MDSSLINPELLAAHQPGEVGINTLIHPQALQIFQDPAKSLCYRRVTSEQLREHADQIGLEPHCNVRFYNGDSYIFNAVAAPGRDLTEMSVTETDQALSNRAFFLLHPFCKLCSKICKQCILLHSGREVLGLSEVSPEAIIPTIKTFFEI